MKSVVIENPILNSPFDRPRRHFRFDEDGITDDIIDERRPSSCFLPVAPTRRKSRSNPFETLWTQDRAHLNAEVNFLRSRVDRWRDDGRPGITAVTRRLLEYWTWPDRERPLFYCQVEALETFIYLAEAAEKHGDAALLARLREVVRATGFSLPRQACKMATGTGKTVVMAMLIAWQTLNRRVFAASGRYSDAFLVVTPGITVRDRLRVLLPSDPGNYYQAHDLVPAEALGDLGTARIAITNYHAFRCRDRGKASRQARMVLGDQPGAFTETPAQMVRRVCRELGRRRDIVVLNDEAHHCYRSRPAADGAMSAERGEAARREQAARLWLNGVEAVQTQLGVRTVIDLSATPFYQRDSGYPEGTLFPWVVSDFSLIDAIESGIVKVPRVPIADHPSHDAPSYRHLSERIRNDLPQKDRGVGPTVLPSALETALGGLYENYRRSYLEWEQDTARRTEGRTPPVFIVVCSNTAVSKLVFDYIAGRETRAVHADGTPVVVAGQLPIFSNAEQGRWKARPNTILVDSAQMESEEGLSSDFKKLACAAIEEFKAEVRGRDAEALTDQDLMREVLNTVGKVGKLGEHIKCVVSVAMLSEGWDVQTVTHILGVRAFSTQLLCEQVIGRALRRRTYTLNEQGRLDPEYAEVFGVPFSFLPCAGSSPTRFDAVPRPVRVHAVPERLRAHPHLEIRFPRLTGYRYEPSPIALEARFRTGSRFILSRTDLPGFQSLDELQGRRPQEIAYALARRVLENHLRDSTEDGAPMWLFPQVLAIVQRWLREGHVECTEGTFPQLLLLEPMANVAAAKIHQAIRMSRTTNGRELRAVLAPHEGLGTTSSVSFDTTKPTWRTAGDRSHVSHVTCAGAWEEELVRTLEALPRVQTYVKNQGLGFKVPYIWEGQAASFHPHYIVRIEDGHAEGLNLVLHCFDRPSPVQAAGAEAMKRLWVPAVNNERIFGRWDFLELRDPSQVGDRLRAFGPVVS